MEGDFVTDAFNVQEHYHEIAVKLKQFQAYRYKATLKAFSRR